MASRDRRGARTGRWSRTKQAEVGLDEAIAAARKARWLLPGEPDTARVLTHYWEAQAQVLAGRAERARAAFEAFLAAAGCRAHRHEIHAAKAWLGLP